MLFRDQRFEVGDIPNEVLVKNEDDYLSGKLLNISKYGCQVQLDQPSSFFTSQESYLRISVLDNTLYVGCATVARSHGNEVGLRVTQGECRVHHLEALVARNKLENQFQITESVVAPEFKALLCDFAVYISRIKHNLEGLETINERVVSSELQKVELDSVAIDEALKEYGPRITDYYQQFKALLESIESVDITSYKDYFRTLTHPLFLSVPFLERAFRKPLGYAGDYGLMVMLYDYKDIGNTLFSKFFHRFTCNEEAAVANKNRVHILKDILVDKYEENKKIKASIIACGPCREVELFYKAIELNLSGKEDISLYCIDNEQESLEYASSKLTALSYRHVNFRTFLFKENAVMGLVKKREPLMSYIESSDVIISAGLFDYLADKVSKKLISTMFESLAPGGKLIIGNVNKDNKSEFSMSFITEWELNLRDENDLLALVEPHVRDSAKKVDVISEDLGINLFLRIEK